MTREMTNNQGNEVPIWCKANLTVKEAAEYSNIGEHSIISAFAWGKKD